MSPPSSSAKPKKAEQYCVPPLLVKTNPSETPIL
jgi:hypothetical protein